VDVSEGQLAGTVAVFDRAAVLRGHLERMDRHAFDAVLAESDARMLVNHDPNLLLGRQGNGTLEVEARDEGLAVVVDLPDTSTARDVRELVRRGDLNGGSFGFIPGEDRWTRSNDGRQVRTHTRVSRLLDVSVVTFPAYDGTAVALRSMDGVEWDGGNGRGQLVRARRRIRNGG